MGKTSWLGFHPICDNLVESATGIKYVIIIIIIIIIVYSV